MRRLVSIALVAFVFVSLLSGCYFSNILNVRRAEENSFLLTEYSIDEIWQIEERTEFVSSMFIYVCELCDYGDRVEVLNDAQRTFYIVRLLDMEVNNGGFSQFFFNSSGAFSNELVAACKEIGALEVAQICQRAIDLFDCEIPVDHNERLDAYYEYVTSDSGKVLEAGDEAFYSTADEFEELTYQYVLSHRESFS